ncbi:unnamed protein product [Brachionus calyciflorus]|uniref:Major facilitator superfamily domain-containing protein 12 n=1 Tax=Brachionus calyciflorus TaxID=104777 RepID=A0A814EJW0_9BILA|nr:unnamed protein product [Brachionus calyciflorus]
MDQLSLPKKLSYGVGHVLNDLTASMWFSYLLIYLHRVVNFSNSLSGYMMLLGQVSDAISTAFVGFESDRTESGFCNYGRRKTWHLVGVISVLMSFPFMFNLCIGCENAPEWARFYYYAPFVFIFQFGWAATQISHLSLIPQLSHCENERVSLNAIRYAFTVASNLFTYGAAFLLLKLNNDASSDDTNLSRDDAPKFMYLSIIVCVVGLIFQIIFHVGTNEENLLSEEEIREKSTSFSNRAKLDWAGYLKSYRFYLVAALYMCTRLIVNMTQVYYPMFLTDTLQLDKSSIALIPFICFLSGFLATFPLRRLNKHFGDYIVCLFGLVIILFSSGLFWYDDIIYGKKVTSIVTSILLGSGSTIILCTSLTLTTDLIGSNTGSGAFVFGAMSFTDKLSNGLAVAVLQQFSPCQQESISCDCRHYYHTIMSALPSVCALLAFISLVLLYINRPRSTESNSLLVNQGETENQNYGTIES